MICRCCGASYQPKMHNVHICESCAQFGLNDEDFDKLQKAAAKVGKNAGDIVQAYQAIEDSKREEQDGQ